MVKGFEAAIERYQRRVYTFARYYLGKAEEAEDITQEVLLKLWQKAPDVEERGMQAWLLKVTRNACFDRLRRRQTAARFMTEDPEEKATSQALDVDPGPDRLAESADFQRHLKGALEGLADPMRSIVILREIQGLKYNEISETLDIPLNTVRVYLHRGRQRLRESLKEVYGHAGAA